MQFPPALVAAIEALLEGVPRKELVAAAQAQSAGVQARSPSLAAIKTRALRKRTISVELLR